MKILAIVGTNRKRGLIDKLIDSLLEGATEKKTYCRKN